MSVKKEAIKQNEPLNSQNEEQNKNLVNEMLVKIEFISNLGTLNEIINNYKSEQYEKILYTFQYEAIEKYKSDIFSAKKLYF